MHRPQRPSGWDTPSPPATRSQSVASIASVAAPPLARRPEPAYVAASAASQIVTNDQDPHALDLATHVDDVVANPEPALVTAASLKLVNDFLDHLLYNFLAVARSTSFVALRPAIHEVLRPTVAAEAIAGADQELQEYLGAGLERELASSADAVDGGLVWDLDTVWRRARLRCMVYSSLGDMEEEDEGSFLSDDHASVTDATGHRPDEVEAVSPAVAIFLASILEFIGEQILLLAAHAALQRTQPRTPAPTPAASGASQGPGGHNPVERLIVEELDTEKVALHPTFGRLWRTWRKRLRSPSASFSRSISRDSILARRPHQGLTASSRRSSVDTLDGPSALHDRSRPTSLTEVPEEDVTLAANIALPMSENDVEEIEVPGVAEMRGQPPGRPTRRHGKRRPRSLVILSPIPRDHREATSATSPSSTSTLPASPKQRRTRLERARSTSLPTPVRSPFHVKPEELTDEGTFFTPLQSPDQYHASRSDSTLNRPDAKMSSSRGNSSSSSEDVDGPPPPKADPSTRTTVAATGRTVSPDEDASMVQASPPSEDPQAGPSSRLPLSGASSTPEVYRSSRPDAAAAILATVGIHQPAGDQTDARADHPPRPVGLPTSEPPDADLLIDTPPVDRTSRTGASVRAGPVDSSSTRAPLQRLVIDGTDDGEEMADPDAIGVAHTSNVPMPAPLSSPSIRRKSRPIEEGRSTGAEEGPHGREPLVSDHGSSRPGAVDKRRLRYDFVSQSPDALDHSPNAAAGSPSSDAQRDATTASSRASGAVSPLNPLEELTEDLLEGLEEEDEPVDASDDRARSDSAVIPSSFVHGHSPQIESPSSSMQSMAKKRSSGSRASDSRNVALSTASGSSADRASVQRVFTPPMTPREDSLPRSKRSESVNKGSHSPQLATRVKGVLSRHPDEPPKAGRTGRHSQDDGSRRETTERSSPGEPRSQATERSFEQLIRSDETIQYTLTPPDPDIDMEGNARRPDVVEASGYVKRTGRGDSVSRHSGQHSLTSRTLVGSPTEPSTARSSKFPPPPSPDPVGFSSTRPGEGRYVPVSGRPQEAVRVRPGAPVARDARIDRTSTKYFADFIRSTGPPPLPAENEAPRRLASPGPSVPSSSGLAPVPAGVAPGGRTSIAKASRAASAPRANRPQPREEKPFGREDSSALVDFIRQGPPDEKQPISKAIAPFRTTLDQDDLAALTNGQPVESMTPQSTVSTRDGSARSQAPSYNSQTALLGNAGTSGGKAAQMMDDAPPIKRKQRRVRDPYAIDTDSEEDVLPTAPAAKARRNETSMMDFLRDMPGPSDPSTTLPSAFDDMPKPGRGTMSLTRGPAGTIKGRLGPGQSSSGKNGPSSQTHSIPQVTINPPSTDPTPPATSSQISRGPPQLSLTSAGRDDSFLGFNQSLGVSASSFSSSSPAEPRTTVPASVIAPFNDSRVAPAPVRSATRIRPTPTDREDTRDLADFLRSSEPPPPPPPVQTTSPRATKEEGGGGFAKLFRKKKSAAVV